VKLFGGQTNSARKSARRREGRLGRLRSYMQSWIEMPQRIAQIEQVIGDVK